MATLNLTPVGNLVKVELTDKPDRYVQQSEMTFIMPSDGGAGIVFQIGGQTIRVDAITDIQVGGVAITNQSDFEAKFAANFIDAGQTALQIALTRIVPTELAETYAGIDTTRTDLRYVIVVSDENQTNEDGSQAMKSDGVTPVSGKYLFYGTENLGRELLIS